MLELQEEQAEPGGGRRTGHAESLAEELEEYDVELQAASTYEQTVKEAAVCAHDLVILDIMGVRGFGLPEKSAAANFPAATLTAHSLTAESLKKQLTSKLRPFHPRITLAR
jgi:DNA-binding response OmpR family regulator